MNSPIRGSGKTAWERTRGDEFRLIQRLRIRFGKRFELCRIRLPIGSRVTRAQKGEHLIESFGEEGWCVLNEQVGRICALAKMEREPAQDQFVSVRDMRVAAAHRKPPTHDRSLGKTRRAGDLRGFNGG